MALEKHNHWMRQALREARRGLGLTSPNPPVGAALVSANGECLAKGWHRGAGQPHAEIEALRKAGRVPAGATLYISLEPCTTHGRTPPCTDAILAAGIHRVVWAMDDPNPRHAGRAAEVLRRAGVKVERGICQDEAEELLRPWVKFMTTGLPYVVAKAGLSLDGRITRPPGESQWLTSEKARADAMKLRTVADAILIGGETARQDNPRLTLRGVRTPAGKPQPWRVILTRSGNLPSELQLFTDAHLDRTLVLTGLSFAEAARDLAARGVVSLLVEGGGRTLAEAFGSGMVDEFHAYVAPMISGLGRPVVDPAAFGSAVSIPLTLTHISRLGSDVKLSYRKA